MLNLSMPRIAACAMICNKGYIPDLSNVYIHWLDLSGEWNVQIYVINLVC
jgi:hypothetical protein